jgi:hypothetical protein
LARVIEIQAELLLSTVQQGLRRKWAWGPFSVGMFLTLVTALPARFGWIHRNHWWGWALLVVFGLLVLIFLAASIGLLLEHEEEAPVQ